MLIRWPHDSVGLTKTCSLHVNARVCQKILNQVSTSRPQMTTIPTILPCSPKIWPKTTIHWAWQQLTTTWQENKKIIQEVTGTFLFYAHAINITMLTALSTIASQWAQLTEWMLNQTKQFLDYAATNDEAIITYHASNIIMAVHSYTSYLSELKACSRVERHFFLSTDTIFPPNNGTIQDMAQLIKNVMLLVAEADFVGAVHQ